MRSICFLCGKNNRRGRAAATTAGNTGPATAAGTTEPRAGTAGTTESRARTAPIAAAVASGGEAAAAATAVNSVARMAQVPHENKYEPSCPARKASMLPQEPFYLQVDRLQAENLLEYRQNGTFLLRPSGNESSLGTLSIIQDGRIFHLSVRHRGDGLVSLGSYKPNEKCFRDLSSLLDYYVSNYLLVFSDGVAYSTLLIPYREINDRDNNN